MLVCLILYKSVKKTALKYFLPFLVLTIIVELSGLWMNQHGIKNYLLFNVFTTGYDILDCNYAVIENNNTWYSHNGWKYNRFTNKYKIKRKTKMY